MKKLPRSNLTATEAREHEEQMGIRLPDKCLRDDNDCEPLSQIQADDKTSFFCCGLNDETRRTVKTDIYRLCFKNRDVDEVSDNDARDLLSLSSVIIQALVVMANHEENKTS